MIPVLVGLYGLLSLSLFLCVALAMAWRSFGREPHAALWSLAYGLSAMNWAVNLLMVWLRPGDVVLTMLGAACTVASFSLIALGFRRRAGLPPRVDAVAAAAGATLLFVAIGLVVRPEGAGAQRWMVLFFCAAMLMVSALSLRRPDRRGFVTGAAPFWMLTLFAAYILGLGVLATMIPPAAGDPAPMLRLFRIAAMLGVPTCLFGVGLFAMFLLAADLADGMRALASSDPLTGLLNRRGLEQAAERAIAICARGCRPLAIIVADIDHFKQVNDRFGHAAGDEALKFFADHATASLRQGDLIGRLGGEEFVFVLPDTNVAQAIEAVERFRHTFARLLAERAPSMVVTASFGVAALGGRDDTLGRALLRADRALYRSKMDGRDRITIAPPEAPAIERIRPTPGASRPRHARG
ncbi:MAG TPA: GGDEF domain-containing protein [Sphingomonas sp.]